MICGSFIQYIYIIIYNIYYIAYQENIHVDSCHVGLITRMPWLPWLQWLPGSMPIILKLPPGAGMGETAREIPKKVQELKWEIYDVELNIFFKPSLKFS